jgi:site-specific DNA-methyltransferase (cytosine-N4-specific)
MLHGLSDDILKSGALERFEGKVNLVFTSPPFPLNRKKRYGNKTGDEYIEWLSSYGPLLKKMLTPDGSIVMEVGNSWEQGAPVMSTLPIRSLLQFQEDNDLFLCQEFVWQNPAKLPSPAQWVLVMSVELRS